MCTMLIKAIGQKLFSREFYPRKNISHKLATSLFYSREINWNIKL